MPSLEASTAALREVLEEEVGAGVLVGGGTMHVSIPGTVLFNEAFGVDGLGRPFSTSSLSNIYCAGKPLLAMSIGALVNVGDLTFETVLGDVLEEVGPGIRGVRLGNLLSHSNGLTGPSGVASVLGLEDPRAEVMRLSPHPEWRPGGLRYSEFTAWCLLAQVLEARGGRDYRDMISELVLRPTGLDDAFVFCRDRDDVSRIEPRLAVSEAFKGTTRYPLLLERTPTWLCRWSPSFGYLSHAAGLGALYRLVADVCEGRRPDQWELTTMVERASGPGYDPVLGRECSYGLGFMVELAGHDFSNRFSETSVGHSGNVGMTAAGVDLATGVVAAYCLSGLSDGDTAVSWLRPRLMRLAFDIADAAG